MNKKWLILGGMLMTVFLTGCENLRSKENLEQLAKYKIYTSIAELGKGWIPFETVDADIKNLDVQCEYNECTISANIFIKKNNRDIVQLATSFCRTRISQGELKRAMNNPVRTVDDPYNMSIFHRPMLYYLALDPDANGAANFSRLPDDCLILVETKR